MECNVGGVEKNVRLVSGAIALTLSVVAPMSRGARIAAMTIGVVEITTALTGYCPVNHMIGRNSCRPTLSDIPKAAEKALQNAQEFAA